MFEYIETRSTTAAGAIPPSAICVLMNSNCVTNDWLPNPSVHATGATSIYSTIQSSEFNVSALCGFSERRKGKVAARDCVAGAQL